MIDAILGSLAARFPDNSINMYAVLTPRTFGSRTNEDFKPFTRYLFQMWGYNEDTILREFQRLQRSIVDTEFYVRYHNDPAEVFWPNALNIDEFEWSDLSRRVVKVALVQAVGTALVESGFSKLAYIKNQWRTRLGLGNAEHQLRIKLNSPSKENMHEFPMYRMAYRWLRAGHIKTDDPWKSILVWYSAFCSRTRCFRWLIK
jgi:hypothetical protein